MISDVLTFVFEGSDTEYNFTVPKHAYTSYQFAKKITMSVLQFEVIHTNGSNFESLYLVDGVANSWNSKYKDGSTLISTEYVSTEIPYKLDKLLENFKFRFRTINGGNTTRTHAIAIIKLDYHDEIQDPVPTFMKRYNNVLS